MFKKSNTALQRKKFSLKPAEILEDLEAVSNVEEQRNKLFQCLDDKPPKERKFDEMGDFLKGSQKLEEISKRLQMQEVQSQMLMESLRSSVADIEEKIKACQ